MRKLIMTEYLSLDGVIQARLAQTLIDHDLVDEYQLWLHPDVLGDGKKLFLDGGPRRDLTLVDSRTTGNGPVILTYGVPPAPAERCSLHSPS
jgi:dihydrofolate reductase